MSMAFPQLSKEILRILIEAQYAGKLIPITEAETRWGNRSSWEDLVDNEYVDWTDEGVFVTERGRSWYET